MIRCPKKKPARRQRQRVDRLAPPNKSMPGRKFRVYPEPGRPHVVEVHVARNSRHMREDIRRLYDPKWSCTRTEGMLASWRSKIDRRPVIRPGQVVARMFLNVQALRRRPGEIVSHECTHAGMAWARLRRANLRFMEGEEVLCYAVGRMVEQVNRCLYTMGAFR